MSLLEFSGDLIKTGKSSMLYQHASGVQKIESSQYYCNTINSQNTCFEFCHFRIGYLQVKRFAF